MDVQSIINRLYPVGSCYMTFSKDDNPSSRFGGVWELVPENYIIKISTEEINNNDGDEYISSDTNNTYSDYGNKNNKTMCPRHNHQVRCQYSGYSGSGYEIKDNTDWSNPSAYSLLALDYYTQGTSHRHEMPHTHTYDPSHIKVYLWKRIEL